jgi:hypothetical protein
MVGRIPTGQRRSLLSNCRSAFEGGLRGDGDQSSATRREVSRYFAFFALSALNLAQRALVTLEIFALAAADIVRFLVAGL